ARRAAHRDLNPPRVKRTTSLPGAGERDRSDQQSEQASAEGVDRGGVVGVVVQGRFVEEADEQGGAGRRPSAEEGRAEPAGSRGSRVCAEQQGDGGGPEVRESRRLSIRAVHVLP